jgi:polyhydroxyalkanoate synthase
MAPAVHRIPLVIVTPWINKFYILDLTPAKSMIRYLLEQGFDVFITSWKNPTSEMRETGFDDYLTQGVDEIVRVARAITGAPKVHAAGYCIGGTLLATYMAWLNRRYQGREEIPVATWTLFASLVDFAVPGDIAAFIDESTVHGLALQMAAAGYLDGKQMAAAFRLLRPNSLIWHYVVHGYLYGEALQPNDVLYWNMDTTRMPCRMHEYYLREMYLHNNLVRKDALTIAGQAIDLSRIVQPLYNVSAIDDHITPWRQTFRINNIVGGPKRCVLSSSGHILGIVNSPSMPSRNNYWVAEAREEDNPDLWQERATQCAGSWWKDWSEWLASHGGPKAAPMPVATAEFSQLADAPGTYVLEP